MLTSHWSKYSHILNPCNKIKFLKTVERIQLFLHLLMCSHPQIWATKSDIFRYVKGLSQQGFKGHTCLAGLTESLKTLCTPKKCTQLLTELLLTWSNPLAQNTLNVSIISCIYVQTDVYFHYKISICLYSQHNLW